MHLKFLLPKIHILYNSLELEHNLYLNKSKNYNDTMSELFIAGNLFSKQKILKLNIGGRNIDVKHELLSVLHQTHWNLLSSLLSGRWDKFLMKDRDNKIFLDCDFEWIEPIFEHLKSQYVVENKIVPIPYCRHSLHRPGYNKAIGIFQLVEEFGFAAPIVGLIGFESMISGVMNDSVQCQFLSQLSPLISAPRQFCHLQLLYRGSSDGFTPIVLNERCAGKVGTLCVAQDHDGNVFGGYNSRVLVQGKNLMVHNDGKFLWSLVDGEVLTHKAEAPPASPHHRPVVPVDCNCFTGFGSIELTLYNLESSTKGLCIGGGVLNPFDIRMNALTRGGIMRLNAAPLKEIEIYQVIPQISKILTSNAHSLAKYEPELLFDHDNKDMSDLLPSLVEPRLLVHSEVNKVRGYSQQLVDATARLAVDEKHLLDELRFVSRFVEDYAGEAITAAPVSESFALVDEEPGVSLSVMADVVLLVERLKTTLPVHCSEGHPDIVYFNVSGEKVCVRRSSVLRALPGSQLAVRLSGNWTEQTEDLDDEGSIFIVSLTPL